MDGKSTLKALILTKGQELGLDPQMIEAMLTAKPNSQDALQLKGTQLANDQKTLSLAQDKIMNPLDVQAKQLAIDNAKAQADLDKTKAELDKAEEQKKTKGEEAIYNLLKKGSLEFSQEFAAKYPQIAERYVNEGGSTVTAQSEDDKKTMGKIKGVEQSAKVLIDNLKKLKPEERGPVGGRAALTIAGITRGSIYRNVAAYDSLRKSLIGPLARAISGEVGVLTDKDIERADGLLPKVDDDPGLAEDKLNNLSNIIKEKGGKGLDLSPLKGKSASKGKSGAYKIELVE